MQILVTGSNGQLGSEIQFLSKSAEHNFIFTDRATLDITDLEALDTFFSANPIDLIINCAAYTAVDKAEDEVSIARQINTTASDNLAKIAVRYDSWLIHISTDYVYDNGQAEPYLETDPVAPKNVYARTKLAGEKPVLSIPKGIVIRTSWVYSSFGNNFVKTMLRLGKEREALSIVFDQIGSPTYARDLAAAVLEIIPSLSEDKAGLYNFSNEGVCSWYDLAWLVLQKENITCEVSPIRSAQYPTKASRPSFSLMDKSKIKETFDLKIRHWQVALDECLALLK